MATHPALRPRLCSAAPQSALPRSSTRAPSHPPRPSSCSPGRPMASITSSGPATSACSTREAWRAHACMAPPSHRGVSARAGEGPRRALHHLRSLRAPSIRTRRHRRPPHGALSPAQGARAARDRRLLTAGARELRRWRLKADASDASRKGGRAKRRARRLPRLRGGVITRRRMSSFMAAVTRRRTGPRGRVSVSLDAQAAHHRPRHVGREHAVVAAE